MKKQRKIFWLLIIVTVCLIVFQVQKTKNITKDYEVAKQQEEQQLQKNVSAGQNAMKKTQQHLNTIKDKVKKVIDDKMISISYYDYQAQAGFNVNGDQMYQSQTLLNLPLSLLLVQTQHGDKTLIDNLLTNEKEATKKGIQQVGSLKQVIQQLSSNYDIGLTVSKKNKVYLSTNQLLQCLNIAEINKDNYKYQNVIRQLMVYKQNDLIAEQNSAQSLIYQYDADNLYALACYDEQKHKAIAILMDSSIQKDKRNDLLKQIAQSLN